MLRSQLKPTLNITDYFDCRAFNIIYILEKLAADYVGEGIRDYLNDIRDNNFYN